MESLQKTAHRAMRALLDGQPETPAKIAFAWRMAAGAALARGGDPEWRNGVLVVRARSDAWRRELRHAQPVLLPRLQELVGPTVIQRLVIE
jgi:predicted nucleic acid-binding Zn ribbon protein